MEQKMEINVEEVIRMFDQIGRAASRRMPERAISIEEKLEYIERDLGSWLHNYPTMVRLGRRSQEDCGRIAEIMIAIRDDYRARLKGGSDAFARPAQG
jgi:hypothetical protein